MHWNATYHALERLKSFTTGGEGDLDDVCGSIDLPHFKEAEKTYISEYVMVLAPLAKALDLLQSDKMAYYGVLLPTIATLIEKLQKIKRESKLQYCTPLVDALIGGMKQRFGYVVEKVPHVNCLPPHVQNGVHTDGTEGRHGDRSERGGEAAANTFNISNS
ncbi:hypothetical protein AAFF_G00129080 [Aldrovandia affinis]|uniref:Uncharacterized protein n=1 Tax=Aldrovandia affinis TaxID=143900 RepID=A0AAD7WX89_9TELE|nr:hypothetical protein AAFF_G00129080 [Aldrovandia affinis]